VRALLWGCRYDAHVKSNKGGSSLATELGKLMDEDTTRWLLTEMAQNRDKKIIRDKVTAPPFSSRLYLEGDSYMSDQPVH
jgi:hypothetical protein